MTRREFLDRCQRFAGYLSGQAEARRPRRRHARQPAGVHDRAVRHHRQPRHAGLDRADGDGSSMPVTSSRDATPVGRDRRRAAASDHRGGARRRSLAAARASWSTATSRDGLAAYENAAEPLDFATAKCRARGHRHRLLHLGHDRRAEGLHAASRLVAARHRHRPSPVPARLAGPAALLPAVLLCRPGHPAADLARLARHDGRDAPLLGVALLGRRDDLRRDRDPVDRLDPGAAAEGRAGSGRARSPHPPGHPCRPAEGTACGDGRALRLPLAQPVRQHRRRRDEPRAQPSRRRAGRHRHDGRRAARRDDPARRRRRRDVPIGEAGEA